MDLVRLYECFCDRTRLRVLNLLLDGPLCVCHLQEILGEPQVKLSRHLAYLRTRGAVERHRHHNWNIYALPRTRPPELDKNLRCLQDCATSDKVFTRDRRNLRTLAVDCELAEHLRARATLFNQEPRTNNEKQRKTN